eukprot:CAMPEP_0197526438 /NCGR_PEP_ID=MMETSP1318-20131121/17833_1 /TAXON_ID=552666 /ORGANISM="Partenskyella glossopodia, Strain RCC365" /LENGTH=64 /DNA_ID=CAMNT_0043080601 /DNA_START=1537 /DNA_END=1731 /DNA_ORIENTATION=+
MPPWPLRNVTSSFVASIDELKTPSSKLSASYGSNILLLLLTLQVCGRTTEKAASHIVSVPSSLT